MSTTEAPLLPRSPIHQVADTVLKPATYVYYFFSADKSSKVTPFDPAKDNHEEDPPSWTKTVIMIVLFIPSVVFGSIAKVFALIIVGDQPVDIKGDKLDFAEQPNIKRQGLAREQNGDSQDPARQRSSSAMPNRSLPQVKGRNRSYSEVPGQEGMGQQVDFVRKALHASQSPLSTPRSSRLGDAKNPAAPASTEVFQQDLERQHLRRRKSRQSARRESTKLDERTYSPKNRRGSRKKLAGQFGHAQRQKAKEEPKGFTLNKTTLEAFERAKRAWQEVLDEDKELPESLKDYAGCKPFHVTSTGYEELGAGIAHSQGQRPTMEDAAFAKDFSFNGKSGKLFGVFDGHGGDETSNYVANQFPGKLKTQLENEFNKVKDKLDTLERELSNLKKTNSTERVIKRKENRIQEIKTTVIANAFTAVCVDLNKEAIRLETVGGTTAIVTFVYEGRMYTANVGDSRGVWVRARPQTLGRTDVKSIRLSEDAKPDEKRFSKAITKAGYEVTHDEEVGDVPRIDGDLAVARNIGLYDLPGVPCRPKMTDIPIPDGRGHYLVLACDGLWDVGSSDEIAEVVRELHRQGKTPKQIAEILVRAAVASDHEHAEDNVSVLVVDLHPVKKSGVRRLSRKLWG